MKKAIILLFLLFSFYQSIGEASAQETRVAVLPFRNLMQKEDLNWLSEGIAATITTKLANMKGMSLVERSQLQLALKEVGFQKAGVVDESTAVKAGKILGVHIVVIGEFQVIGDQVRISARFVEVETAKVKSTAVVTGSFQNIFSLQDDVSLSLAKSLNIDLPEDFKKDIKTQPTGSITAYEYYSKGFSYWSQGDANKAIEHYLKAVSLDPNYENALFELGYAYSEKGEYQKAIDYYGKALLLNPKAKDATYNMGLVYTRMQDYPNAEKWYRKSLELDPNYSDALNNMGVVMLNTKRYAEAELWYKKALQNNPGYHLAYYNLGLVYENLNQTGRSMEHYKKAIELKPDYADAMIRLALLLEIKEKNFSEAEHWYNKAVSTNPNNYLGYYNLGFLYSNKEFAKYDADKAIYYYQQAIIAKPDYDQAYFYMANLYTAKKEYAKAINAYEKAIQIYAKEPLYYNNLGLAYEIQKNYINAEKYYRKAVELKPDFGLGWENLGYALYSQYKDGEAVEAWKKAASLGMSRAKEALKQYFGITY
jgi:tetratricopeptide (TPR) repeat protein